MSITISIDNDLKKVTNGYINVPDIGIKKIAKGYIKTTSGLQQFYPDVEKGIDIMGQLVLTTYKNEVYVIENGYKSTSDTSRNKRMYKWDATNKKIIFVAELPELDFSGTTPIEYNGRLYCMNGKDSSYINHYWDGTSWCPTDIYDTAFFGTFALYDSQAVIYNDNLYYYCKGYLSSYDGSKWERKPNQGYAHYIGINNGFLNVFNGLIYMMTNSGSSYFYHTFDGSVWNNYKTFSGQNFSNINNYLYNASYCVIGDKMHIMGPIYKTNNLYHKYVNSANKVITPSSSEDVNIPILPRYDTKIMAKECNGLIYVLQSSIHDSTLWSYDGSEWIELFNCKAY